MGKGKGRKADSARQSGAKAKANVTPAPSGGGRKVLTRDTLIADVTDYAIELYARERAEKIAESPEETFLPRWLVFGLLAAIAAVGLSVALLLMQGPRALAEDSMQRTLTFVFGGVVVLLALTTLMMRGSRMGALPRDRVTELEDLDKRIKAKFDELGIKCYGCGAAYGETFEAGAKVHQYDLDTVLAGIGELGLDLERTRTDKPVEMPAAVGNSDSGKGEAS